MTAYTLHNGICKKDKKTGRINSQIKIIIVVKINYKYKKYANLFLYSQNKSEYLILVGHPEPKKKICWHF